MWSSSISNAFDNDPTLKDILAATYTSSTRRNYAVLNGVDKSILPIAEELIQQGFNIFMIGSDANVLDQVKDELKDISNDNELNLAIDYICILLDDWTKPDTIKSIENVINDLDFPCLLVNNYRFYNKTSIMPMSSPFGLNSINSPSLMLFQSMMKTFPCTTVLEIVGKSFYSMQKSRGIDLGDDEDVSKYQALDSLVLNRSNSAKKRAMKKLALLNIREYTKVENIAQKSTSETNFMTRHHEFWRTDDNEKEDEEKEKEAPAKESEEQKDYMQLVEQYTVSEEKLWDCYQLFCKLINYKYNPYDDKEIEDYLIMQEMEGEMALIESEVKSHKGLLSSIWPFGN